ncbi:hypothetical protein ACIBBB_27755 [Streptomyces sp. NPDC051217]|uniref:hypothetical protein n=1 Tax=Streptomyces sp. NPDC051217 TaxID=3365644 RepID=UPI0037A559DD
MKNPMTEYSTLIRLDPAELPQSLRRGAPPKAPGQWIFALLDIAYTDYYPVNQEPDISLTVRLIFASKLLGFVDEELDAANPTTVTLAYMKIARMAIEENAHDVPSSLLPDAVVARALRCFRLTRTRALEVAKARRDRYLNALNEDLEEDEFMRAVRVDGDSELQTIEVLLPEFRQFQENVTEAHIADDLNAWLGINSELALGDDVEKLLGVRRRRRQAGP